MTLILELPSDLQSQVEAEARQRGTDAQAIVIEATRARFNGTTRALSPMESAVAYIKANPIRALGPIDAAADLEEVRAGQDR